MRRLMLLLILMAFYSISYAEEKPAEKTKAVKEENQSEVLDYASYKLTTDKGTEVRVNKLICGVLRKMEKGERVIQGYTSSKKPIYSQAWHRQEATWESDVPVIDGYIFGAFIVFSPFPKGEKLTIEVVDTPPNEYEVSGKKLKQLKQSYDLITHEKNYPFVTTLNKEEPQLMQLGLWKKEFYNNGKLIFSYTYNLIKASEDELKQNAVYEDYLKKAKESQQPAKEEPKKK